jgi:hypothetical protein
MMQLNKLIKFGVVLILNLISYNILFSQPDERHSRVYVNEPNQSIKTEVLSKKNSFDADENRTYYWYANNQILSTKGGFDGKLLDGKYSSFYLNNNLKESGNFKNGVKSGEWRSWYETGQLKESIRWKKGMRKGHCEMYNEKGEKILTSNYKNDLLNGKQLSYQFGKVLFTKKYKKGAEIIPKEKPKVEKVSKEKKGKVPEKIKRKEKIKTPKERKSIFSKFWKSKEKKETKVNEKGEK